MCARETFGTFWCQTSQLCLCLLTHLVFLSFISSLGIISSLMDHTVNTTLKFLSDHCQPVLTSGYGSTNKPSKTAAGVHEVQTLLRYLSAIFDRHILREDEDSEIQMINQKQRQSVSSISSRQSSGISASDTGRVVSSFAFAFVWAFGGHLHERYNKLKSWIDRSFSLTWPSAILVYRNKRLYLHKNRVKFPEDLFGTLIWPTFLCFGTPIWPPWRHAKRIYRYHPTAI